MLRQEQQRQDMLDQALAIALLEKQAKLLKLQAVKQSQQQRLDRIDKINWAYSLSMYTLYMIAIGTVITSAVVFSDQIKSFAMSGSKLSDQLKLINERNPKCVE